MSNMYSPVHVRVFQYDLQKDYQFGNPSRRDEIWLMCRMRRHLIFVHARSLFPMLVCLAADQGCQIEHR
jgi:hypothetical protein